MSNESKRKSIISNSNMSKQMRTKEPKFDCFTLDELEEIIEKTRNRNSGYEQLNEYIDIQSVLIDLTKEVRRLREYNESLLDEINYSEGS